MSESLPNPERIERLLVDIVGRHHLRAILTPDELAHSLRVPASVILAALASGELPGRKFPGLGWRISKRAAECWLATGNGEPDEPGTRELHDWGLRTPEARQ
jgi:excisionase family DNA binding protein